MVVSRKVIAMPRIQGEPLGNFRFTVEAEGFASTGFAEMSGLEIETEVIEYRDGNNVGDVRKIPGLNKAGDITLKRGVATSFELWDWYKTVLNRKPQRRDVVISLLNEDLEPSAQWRLFNAWPRKYVGPVLNAQGNQIAIEELVIVSERIEMLD
jgi:phage tail-like protein